MTDRSDAQFDALRQKVAEPVAGTLIRFLTQAPEYQVNRISPRAFAADTGFDETACIDAFLQATWLGLVDLSWDVVCGTCGGVLSAAASLRAVDREQYHCALCNADCQTSLDDGIEVSFTVSPRLRRIAAHDPDSLDFWNYLRQVYWSSGMDFPGDLRPLFARFVEGQATLPGGKAMEFRFAMHGTVSVFDPVTHLSTILTATGPQSPGPQNISPQEVAVTLGEGEAPSRFVEVQPGAIALTISNAEAVRALPGIWRPGPELRDLLSRRRPRLTAERLLSNQTFRDLYRVDLFAVDQHFRITEMTFMFTDLKGSTALYSRVGDLAAFELVLRHFTLLTETIRQFGGALVKTIGDAVMATFPTPAAGLGAALEMQRRMGTMVPQTLAPQTPDADPRAIRIKIGLHAGPCLAVMLNASQDFFGQTVNVAARVQSVAEADTIVVTGAVLADPAVQDMVDAKGLQADAARAILRGIEEEMTLYTIRPT